MFSVVVPTYNERENVRALVEGVLDAFGGLSESAELIFVDDDSPDGTADEVRRVAAEFAAADRVRVVVREGERDLAGAVERGFQEASGDVIAVMDADLSHPPEILPRLLEAIRSGRADVAVASRRVKGGGVSDWPLRRRFVSWGAGLLARPLVPVKDTTSGFFALKADCIEGVELRARGYKIGLEVLARGRYAVAEEIPFVFVDRRHGRSKLGGAVCLAYLAQLAALYRWKFPTLVRYVQFALVGAVGMLVDAAVFNMAYQYAGLATLGREAGGFLAQTVSFVAAAALNFVLNRAWTFREHAARARLWVFLLVCAGGYLVRSAVFDLVIRAGPAGGMRVPGVGAAVGLENVALFCGIVVASVWNFFGSRRWAFGAEGVEPARPEPVPTAAALRSYSALVGLLAALTLARLVYAGLLDLAADEAYYWQWSRHLDWGYHDHPPMVAYLIAAGTRLAGSTELGVRLLTIAVAAAGTWIVYRMAAEYAGSEWAGAWAGTFFALAPMFAVGSVITTPDSPFVFFWIGAVWRTQRALARRRLRDWVGVGVWLGLGMLSKYPMVLLPVALLAALVLMREGRRALGTPGPYVAAVVGATVCVPFLVWIVHHEWASVIFQLGHGLGPVAAGEPSSGGLRSFLEFVIGQAGVVSPVLFVVLVWALVAGARETVRTAGRATGARVRPPGDGTADGAAREVGTNGKGPDGTAREVGTNGKGPDGTALFVTPALITLAVFAAASFLARSEANWPAAAYPTVFVLAGAVVARWMAAPGRGRKALAWTALGVAAAMSLYVHVEAVYPLFPYERGAFAKVRDRSGFARWADEVRRSRGEEGTRAHLCAEDYRLASLLAFYLPGQPETYAPTERGSGSQYAVWEGRLAAGEPAWFFTRGGGPPDALEDCDEAGRLVEKRTPLFGGAREVGVITAYYGRLRACE